CPFNVCGPNHAEEGPWQLSQLTPSFTSKSRPFSAGETARAWHARHFGAFSALPIPRIEAMRCDTGFCKTDQALACLSFTTQMLYSFCRMGVTFMGWMPPWHATALHEPGPRYFAICGLDSGFCADTPR